VSSKKRVLRAEYRAYLKSISAWLTDNGEAARPSKIRRKKPSPHLQDVVEEVSRAQARWA